MDSKNRAKEMLSMFVDKVDENEALETELGDEIDEDEDELLGEDQEITELQNEAIESESKRLSRLRAAGVENEKELQEEDTLLSTLSKKTMDYKNRATQLLSMFVDKVDENEALGSVLENEIDENERELLEEDEEISELQNEAKESESKRLSHLVDVEVENENELQEEDALLSSLTKKTMDYKNRATKLISMFVDKVDENEALESELGDEIDENESELLEEDEEISQLKNEIMKNKDKISTLQSKMQHMKDIGLI
mmetsp:Transcript_9112/g.15842  ORF Transcript_9112/g.15842 Transcript_9112/m.15842 type:complete len:255 (-) Transcript_9112:340-1104(-)